MTGTRRDRKLPAAVDAVAAVLTASIRIIDDGNNMSVKWVFYAICQLQRTPVSKQDVVSFKSLVTRL
jgi:hypothetical protein